VDSGSTDTFMDYTFASKTNCKISSTTSKVVKVAGGGQLNTSAMITSTPYSIQHEEFCGDFKLLQFKGHDIILGCDWIKLHSPIGLDLRTDSRQLFIHKNGTCLDTKRAVNCIL
jgi:hypothetical protein